MLLVRVRMFNPPAESDCPATEPTPDVLCDLRPEEARQLALELLQAAEDAERQTLRADRGASDGVSPRLEHLHSGEEPALRL